MLAKEEGQNRDGPTVTVSFLCFFLQVIAVFVGSAQPQEARACLIVATSSLLAVGPGSLDTNHCMATPQELVRSLGLRLSEPRWKSERRRGVGAAARAGDEGDSCKASKISL